ncbi:DNA replication/repair protein RecF [Proteiniphilum saccharofermentans]|uniref:DNA replication/repair protein RecF n=1 Tax=Proteiniphilum saccharofermentans TaxID=1642647 RepID=UPI0028AEC46F|nr:DNA replication/repair protein RecF [Proteiniphilum saccharofermentans]
MILKELSLINYKNLTQADLTLSPKMNCFIGNNGMGKTNLLDAIYYLSFCRSYTNPVDSQIIRHGEEVCLLQGKYEFEDDTKEEVYCAIRRRQKKQFKRNKKEYERLSDHIGLIPLVMISPADNELITGGSEVRRRFMDMAVSQFDKEYLRALLRYNKTLQQRNVLLKNEESLIDFTLLDLWEEQMAEAGAFIYNKRKEFIEEFTPIFNQFYANISQSGEQVSFSYTSQLDDADFLEKLRHNRQRDVYLGHTSVGIHRDELEMLLDGYPIKKVGSQGQNKTYFVSLKLAQFHFLLKTGRTTPILLLDDIFDRLDAKRVEEIVKLVSGSEFGQIFISDTNRGSLDKILARVNNNSHIYSVVDGEINLMKG